jgi:fatty-acid desaturase
MSLRYLAPNADRRPDARRRLPLPRAVDPRQISWRGATLGAVYHTAALLALVPWFFSWIGVVVCVASIVVFGQFGIAIGYHRLLTHRGFTCPKWLEHVFAVLGVCCLQDTPARWVAVHRWHHQYSDQQTDPHSPLVRFFWAHVGWVVVENGDLKRLEFYERYAKDILHDRFYLRLERKFEQIKIILISWLVFFLLGFIPQLLIGKTFIEALQFGGSILVWGVFVRTVAVWHQTWSVNSVTHLWGYRNFATDDDSRNNIWVAIFTHGEGWHNNHHANPRSVNHGHLWWEVDITYQAIRLLSKLGLAHDLVVRNPPVTRALADAP